MSFNGQKRMRQVRICRLTEPRLPEETEDNGKRRIKENICARRTGEPASKIEREGCNDDKKKTAKGEG
jgi:hypothetical protein